MKNKLLIAFGLFTTCLSVEVASAGMISQPVSEPVVVETSIEEAVNEFETELEVLDTNINPSKKLDTKFVVPDTDAQKLATELAKGKSYVWGGNSDVAVDCSSFAQQFMRAYKGIEIPRVTFDQVKVGKLVSEPAPGDLVFFNDFTHVGVYVGDGMMVDALNPKEGVGLRAVSYVHGKVDGYYRY